VAPGAAQAGGCQWTGMPLCHWQPDRHRERIIIIIMIAPSSADERAFKFKLPPFTGIRVMMMRVLPASGCQCSAATGTVTTLAMPARRAARGHWHHCPAGFVCAAPAAARAGCLDPDSASESPGRTMS
jgi:hypothetical protein